MGWTKRQIVEKALGVTGLASYNVPVSVPRLMDGMSSLNAMMAAWDALGIRLGYLSSATPTSGDLAQDSGIPDWAVRAVYMNLGIEIAASVGREVSTKAIGIAERMYQALLAHFAAPTPMRMPETMPTGAGNKPGWAGVGPFFVDEESDDLVTGNDSELEFK